MDKIRLIISKAFLWLLVRIYNVLFIYRRIRDYADNFALTIGGIAIAFALMTPFFQDKLSMFSNYDNIYLGMGALIGGMLTLSFSFSLIPVQRAMDTFTQAVSRLYITDVQTQIVFAGLSLLCLSLFSFSLFKCVGIPHETLFPLSLLCVAISFDFVRWHHRRVCKLLTPDYAIKNLAMLAHHHIRKVNQNVRLISEYYKRIFSQKSKENIPIEHIRGAIFAGSQKHRQSILWYTDQLSEICQKAIFRGEVDVARKAIQSIGGVAIAYIKTRQNSLFLYPTMDTLFVFNQTDMDSILNPIYVSLLETAQRTTKSQYEDITVEVVLTLSQINESILYIKLKLHNALLFTAPVYHIKETAVYAQRHDSIEPAISASTQLTSLAKKAIGLYDEELIIRTIIENWDEIILFFNVYKNGIFMNKVIDDLLDFTRALVFANPFCLTSLFEYTLQKIEAQISFGKKTGVLYGKQLVNLPYSSPYNLINKKSLGQLFTDLYNHLNGPALEIQPESFKHFSRTAKEIEDHFYRCAYAGNLGNTHLLWYMISTLLYRPI
jgi:hypothetical protein